MRPTRSAVVSVACLLSAFSVPSTGVAGDGPARPPETLTFREARSGLGERAFLPERVARLAGQPVRIVGYMAHFLEDPPKGMFYLCPLPVSLDEGGAGTGDLPPDHIRVSVPALAAPAGAVPAASAGSHGRPRSRLPGGDGRQRLVDPAHRRLDASRSQPEAHEPPSLTNRRRPRL